MDDRLQEEVFGLIEDAVCVKQVSISLEKSLNVDLGMDGDDAVEFFEAFAEKFHVDLTVLDEEWDRYFVPEGFSLFDTGEILTLFAARERPPTHPRMPLPVSRLISAVHEGKWTKTKD